MDRIEAIGAAIHQLHMVDERKAMTFNSANDKDLRVYGVSRLADNSKGLMVSFSRPLTDDELRAFHETCKRSIDAVVQIPRSSE